MWYSITGKVRQIHGGLGKFGIIDTKQPSVLLLSNKNVVDSAHRGEATKLQKKDLDSKANLL